MHLRQHGRQGRRQSLALRRLRRAADARRRREVRAFYGLSKTVDLQPGARPRRRQEALFALHAAWFDIRRDFEEEHACSSEKAGLTAGLKKMAFPRGWGMLKWDLRSEGIPACDPRSETSTRVADDGADDASAKASADCGFWPVMSCRATTTCDVHGSPLVYLPPLPARPCSFAGRPGLDGLRLSHLVQGTSRNIPRGRRRRLRVDTDERRANGINHTRARALAA